MTADFSGAPLFGCAPLIVNFSDASTGPVANWLWDFGDGQFSEEQSPTHEYDQPGIYTVMLTTTEAAGASAVTRTRAFYVQVIGPTVSFSQNPTAHSAVPANVLFNDLTVFGAPITSWLWDFGDGNTSSAQNPFHSYTAAGIYPVSLTVTDIDGCSRTLLKPGVIQVIAGASVNMTDQVIANPAGIGRAQPGSVIRYTVTVENTGTRELTGAEISIDVDPNTTLIPESINEQD